MPDIPNTLTIANQDLPCTGIRWRVWNRWRLGAFGIVEEATDGKVC